MYEHTNPLDCDDVTRRRALSGAGLIASAAVAGCTGPLGDTSGGTEDQPARLWLEAVEARSVDGNELVVYLIYDDQQYRVGLVNGDNVIAHPDAPF